MQQQSLNGILRNPRVSFRGHTDSESIRVDETFVEIHAEDDNDNDNDNDNDTDFEYQPANRPGTDMDVNTDMDLITVDNNWAAQGFEYLNRRPPRSQQPRFTNPNQLSRQSCFFQFNCVFIQNFTVVSNLFQWGGKYGSFNKQHFTSSGVAFTLLFGY